MYMLNTSFVPPWIICPKLQRWREIEGLRSATSSGRAAVRWMAIARFSRCLETKVPARRRERLVARQMRLGTKYKGRAPNARRKAADVLRLARAGKTRETIAEELRSDVASVYRILASARATGAIASP